MAFSIRLSEEEKKLADSYARLHSMSMGEAFKQAANDAYREYVQGGKKSKPVADLWKELEL